MRKIASGKQLACEVGVYIHGVIQLSLADEFTVRMGYENGARAEEERFSPSREFRDVGGERGGHDIEPGDSPEALVGNIENEIDFRAITDSGDDPVAQRFRGGY